MSNRRQVVSLAVFLTDMTFYLRYCRFSSRFQKAGRCLFAHSSLGRRAVIVGSRRCVTLRQVVAKLFSVSPGVTGYFRAMTLMGRFSQGGGGLTTTFIFFVGDVCGRVRRSALSPVRILLDLQATVASGLLCISVATSSRRSTCAVFRVLGTHNSTLRKRRLLGGFVLENVEPSKSISATGAA